MGGVSIKNTRILMLLMILTIAMITLGSSSANDVDTNETLSMAEIDTIDISQENIIVFLEKFIPYEVHI
ncbi:MAG: hypothetical protein IJQ68_01020 [Methanobrevibacter sp.]|uniref:hypothetical protein n=1 Tax=Methanobrevibacter sp. TaxID=66852 RepID=UPI0025E63EA1|nr:hypothetical protein [Methanobrevibacter sp.]MBR0270567.1 hypothetical protein [Methanobrevibacter sp.]